MTPSASCCSGCGRPRSTRSRGSGAISASWSSSARGSECSGATESLRTWSSARRRRASVRRGCPCCARAAEALVAGGTPTHIQA
eukprot:6967088-Prymnesium_polylepis.1